MLSVLDRSAGSVEEVCLLRQAAYSQHTPVSPLKQKKLNSKNNWYRLILIPLPQSLGNYSLFLTIIAPKCSHITFLILVRPWALYLVITDHIFGMQLRVPCIFKLHTHQMLTKVER